MENTLETCGFSILFPTFGSQASGPATAPRSSRPSARRRGVRDLEPLSGADDGGAMKDGQFRIENWDLNIFKP